MQTANKTEVREEVEREENEVKEEATQVTRLWMNPKCRRFEGVLIADPN
jgi:hypothetical protein